MPRILLTIAALITAIALAAGCGRGDGAASSSSSGAASFVPADAVVYAEATLRPDGDRQAAIDALVAKFPGEGSAGERIASSMKKSLAEDDPELSWERDIEPWIGAEAALFLSAPEPNGGEPDAAMLIATEDEAATTAMLQKDEGVQRTGYRGFDLYLDPEESDSAAAVVDGWYVEGDPGSVKAAIDVAEGGDPITADDDFEQALEDASEERLGLVYLNTPVIAEQLEKLSAGAAFEQFRKFFEKPMIATADVDESGVRFETTMAASLMAGFPIAEESSDLADELPADAWFAMAQPELGKAIESYVDLVAGALGGRDVIAQQVQAVTGLDLQEDVLSWMGDWGVFVRGASVDELSGALVIETSDEAASGRVIDAVARLARQCGCSVGPLALAGGGEGITVRSPAVPQPLHLFQRDGKVVLAYGDAAAHDALDPARTLGDSPGFAEAQDALGGDYPVSFYLAIEPLLQLVDSTSSSADPGWQEARPYLEPLGALVGGVREDGDKVRSAFGLTVR